MSLVDWLEREGDDLRGEFRRLYVPRNDPRYLRRNAIVAVGNVGRREDVDLLEPYLDCDDELQIVCAPGHPFAKEAFALPAMLTRHPYIGREAGSGTRAVIDRYLQGAGVPPETMNTVVELGSPEAIKGLVATGLGFAIMSRVIVAKELALGELVQVPLRPAMLRKFSAVYPNERFHSKLVAAFLSFAKERLGPEQPLAA